MLTSFAGKTTLSRLLTDRLNALHQKSHPGAEPVAAFVPMDGYHYTRAVLDTFPDPARAHARRGAEFTFDGAAFLKLVQTLRVPLGGVQDMAASSSPTPSSIYAPSFDHARKDPVDDDIEVRPTHRIVVFEGNYVCLDLEPWREAARLMNLRCFVEVEEPVARERLAARHVLAGIVANREEGLRRADENDLVNGRQITENKVPGIDFTVFSREDDEWK